MSVTDNLYIDPLVYCIRKWNRKSLIEILYSENALNFNASVFGGKGPGILKSNFNYFLTHFIEPPFKIKISAPKICDYSYSYNVLVLLCQGNRNRNIRSPISKYDYCNIFNILYPTHKVYVTMIELDIFIDSENSIQNILSGLNSLQSVIVIIDLDSEKKELFYFKKIISYFDQVNIIFRNESKSMIANDTMLGSESNVDLVKYKKIIDFSYLQKETEIEYFYRKEWKTFDRYSDNRIFIKPTGIGLNGIKKFFSECNKKKLFKLFYPEIRFNNCLVLNNYNNYGYLLSGVISAFDQITSSLEGYPRSINTIYNKFDYLDPDVYFKKINLLKNDFLDKRIKNKNKLELQEKYITFISDKTLEYFDLKNKIPIIFGCNCFNCSNYNEF